MINRLMNLRILANRQSILLLLVILTFAAGVEAAGKQKQESIPAPARHSAQSSVAASSVCGGMSFDQRSGTMVPRPNVDLIVKRLEISRNSKGTWIRPTIRNQCSGRVSGEIHVSIGDIVVTFFGLPPKTDYTLGYMVGVPNASAYTVIVDYDNHIRESNELNNRCTRSNSGTCR